MATISTSGISPLQIIKSEQVLRIINALNGTLSNDIIVLGSSSLSLLLAPSMVGPTAFTGSFSISGSNTLIGTNIITGSVFISGSKTIIGTNTITGSLNVIGSTILSGSLNVTQGITGSLFGTASYATTASYVLGTNALSASYAATASYVNPLKQNVSITGSLFVSGTQVFIGTNTITGSLLVSGSTTLSGSLNLTQGITGSLFGTASFAFTSSNTILQAAITPNQTVGGASSATPFIIGTNLEYILRTMLTIYIPPSFGSLTIKSGSTTISTTTREVGASFTANTSSFASTADSPNGVYPLSASFTASGADISTVQYYFGNNVLGATNNLSIGSSNSYTRSTSGSITFTVNGKRADTLALITSSSTTMTFQWRVYLGASSTNITDAATAQTVVNAAAASSLPATKAWTATCTSANDTTGNYTYIIYPAHFGDLAGIIQNGTAPVLGAFTKVGDYNVTNSNSIILSHRVYKSNSDKAFANGTTLTIT